jgi:hypothetical protein
MTDKPILQQFDQVTVLTTKRVSYLSDKPGHTPDPHGLWNVVGFVDGDALLAKDGALIRIPISDIQKTASYEPEVIIDMLRRISGYGQIEKNKKDEGGGGNKGRPT